MKVSLGHLYNRKQGRAKRMMGYQNVARKFSLQAIWNNRNQTSSPTKSNDKSGQNIWSNCLQVVQDCDLRKKGNSCSEPHSQPSFPLEDNSPTMSQWMRILTEPSYPAELKLQRSEQLKWLEPSLKEEVHKGKPKKSV